MLKSVNFWQILHGENAQRETALAVSLCSVLENAAADELAHDGVARDVIGFERRDGVDDLEEVGQPVLVDEGVVKLGVELGDLLEIAREDTRLFSYKLLHSSRPSFCLQP